MKRLFIAINLPAEIKESIRQEQFELEKIFQENKIDFIRFLRPENWHLTISFLGSQDVDEGSPSTSSGYKKIISAIEKTAQNFEPLEIVFEKIVYGPALNQARMIWLKTNNQIAKKLGEIKLFLEEKLLEQGLRLGSGHKERNRPFQGHITLARFSNFQRIKLPEIERFFNQKFKAGSLDLMESFLKRTGAEYKCLEKFEFKS